MLGIGLVIILQLFVGGLQDLEVNVETSSETEYRSAILLEKLLNYDASITEVDYNYDRRRAVIPVELFSNENPDDDEIGYKKNGQDCYIEDIPELDGTNFGFAVDPIDSTVLHASNPKSIDCARYRGTTGGRGTTTSNVIGTQYVSSPALIVRGDNPPLEARIYVYKIN